MAQTLALAKTPFDLVRGSGGEEKVLKNAKDACATEALEIATYTAIERLARSVGDEQTAKLAASIRADEEKMLERIMRELPKLTAAVVGADVEDDPSYDVTKTGAADAARATGKAAAKTARKTGAKAKRSTRQARKVPGVAQAEGQVKGAVASQSDLAIAGYDKLTAEEIVAKLSELSQIELAKVDSYERSTRTARRSSTASARSAATSRGRATTSSPSPSSRPRSARPTRTASRPCAPTSAPTRPAPASSTPPSAASARCMATSHHPPTSRHARTTPTRCLTRTKRSKRPPMPETEPRRSRSGSGSATPTSPQPKAGSERPPNWVTSAPRTGSACCSGSGARLTPPRRRCGAQRSTPGAHTHWDACSGGSATTHRPRFSGSTARPGRMTPRLSAISASSCASTATFRARTTG